MHVRFLLLLLVAACGPQDAPPNSARPAPAPVSYPAGIRAVPGFAPAPRDFPSVADMRRLAADGFRWIRFGIPWDQLESAPGVFDWAPVDAQIDAVHEAGMQYIFTLKYGNPLYPPASGVCNTITDNADDYRCPPADLATFARFAKAAAARYGDRVKVYEIWNEANGWFRFWPVRYLGDPARLAELTALAAKAIHTACTDCKVISGGLVFHDVGPAVLGQTAFFEEMLEAEPSLFSQQLDGVGFHHYTFYPPIQSPENASALEMPLENMLAETASGCRCDLPIWITEAGWTTASGFSELDQARFGVRGFLIALAYGVESWVWWSVRELTNQPLVAPQEAHFGMWNAAGNPRPVYQALRRLLAAHGEAVRVRDARGDFGLQSPSEWAVELEAKDGEKTLILWSDTKNDPTPIPALEGQTALDLITGDSAPFAGAGANPVAIAW